MDYRTLSKEDFDAIVTGELTHYALWLENELIGTISNYFLRRSKKRPEFVRLLLRRDGLTFQDKIDLVRAMLPLFGNQSAAGRMKKLLNQIEEFKAFRNTFAHGVDTTPSSQGDLRITVEVVTRSGKERVVEVSPETHEKLMADTEKLLVTLRETRKSLNRLTTASRATSKRVALRSAPSVV